MPTEEEKKELARLKAEAEQLEEKKRLAALLAAENDVDTSETETETEAETKITFKQAAQNEHWNKLVEAYKAEFHKEPDEKGELSFPSKESALAFFERQAKLNVEFLMSEVCNGKPTGFCAYSCGTGQLFTGSIVEINAQLESALAQAPDNAKLLQGIEHIKKMMPPQVNPVSEMRRKLDEMKEEPEETTPSPLSNAP